MTLSFYLSLFPFRTFTRINTQRSQLSLTVKDTSGPWWRLWNRLGTVIHNSMCCPSTPSSPRDLHQNGDLTPEITGTGTPLNTRVVKGCDVRKRPNRKEGTGHQVQWGPGTPEGGLYLEGGV